MDIFSRFIKCDLIEKGWAKEKKYFVTDATGKRFMLRIYDASQYEIQLKRFQIMQELNEKDICMSEPIEFGICNQGVYALLSWIEGEDFIRILPVLEKIDAYRYGVMASSILLKIHSIRLESPVCDWKHIANQQLDERIKRYISCPLKYENGDLIIDFCLQNRSIFSNRPQTFRHGDFHPGNLIFNDNTISVIDFGLSDYGDPWEEFNRIVWCIKYSIFFAAGLIDGYFNNQIPLDFWMSMAIYLSSKLIYALPWSIPYGLSEIDVVKKQAEDLLDWYHNMQTVIPEWYLNVKRELDMNDF